MIYIHIETYINQQKLLSDSFLEKNHFQNQIMIIGNKNNNSPTNNSNDSKKMLNNDNDDIKTLSYKKSNIAPYKSFIILGTIFLISLSLLYFIYLTFPKLEE
jgi:hypothetical protein